MEVRHALPNRLRAQRVWPVLEGLLRNIAEVEPGYLVEGDILLPDRVAGLLAAYGGKVRACFLGYTTTTVEAKSAAIRSHPGQVNDWVTSRDDDELTDLVAEMIAFSSFLQAECSRHGLKYVDSGGDFDAALDAAEAHLLAG